MEIRFSTRKVVEGMQAMLNLRIEAASVFGHRSSNQKSKESKVTGILADKHITNSLGVTNVGQGNSSLLFLF